MKKVFLAFVLVAVLLTAVCFAEEVISWQDAGKYVGQIKTVEGTVVDVKVLEKISLLNFHTDYKKHFSAVIFPENYAKFPEKLNATYLGKKIKVTGEIVLYKEKPEIVLKDIKQIEIVK